jgi:hypothetical protein
MDLHFTPIDQDRPVELWDYKNKIPVQKVSNLKA